MAFSLEEAIEATHRYCLADDIDFGKLRNNFEKTEYKNIESSGLRNFRNFLEKCNATMGLVTDLAKQRRKWAA